MRVDVAIEIFEIGDDPFKPVQWASFDAAHVADLPDAVAASRGNRETRLINTRAATLPLTLGRGPRLRPNTASLAESRRHVRVRAQRRAGRRPGAPRRVRSPGARGGRWAGRWD